MNACGLDAVRLIDELLPLSNEQRVNRVRALGMPERVVGALAEQVEALSIQNLGRAEQVSEVLLRLTEVLESHAARARASRARGHVLAYCNRYDDALTVLDSAAQLAELSHQPVEAARAKLAMLHAFARLARYDEAIDVGKAARDAFVQAGESMLAAKAQINLGVIHRMRDDPAAALNIFNEARPALAAHPVMLAQLDSNRAEAMLDLNLFGDAERTFLEALTTLEEHGVGRAAAIVEGNLADMMSRQGRLERALYHFEKARRHMETDAAPGDLARLAAEHAEVLASVGLFDEALAGYQQTLPILQSCGLAWEAARAGMGFGRTLMRLGRRNAALPVLEDAATAFAGLGHKTGSGRIKLLLGELAWSNGMPEVSRQLFSGAAELLCDRPAEVAVAQYLMARLELESGAFECCESLLAAALQTAQSLNITPLLADVLHARGCLRRAQGDMGAALTDLRLAADHIERVRGALQAERFRAALLGNRQAIFEDLADALLEIGADASTAEAFAVIERAKSRSLLDRVAGALDASATPTTNGNTVQEERLLTELVRCTGELNALYRRLDDLAPIDRALPLGGHWQDQIAQRETELKVLESRLEATRGITGLFAPSINLESAQCLLKPDWALIEYFIHRGQLSALVVRCNEVQTFVRLTDQARLTETVERFGFQIARKITRAAAGGDDDSRLLKAAQRELRSLYEMLIAPLLPSLRGVRRLVIVPHGLLHTLAFHALWDGERHLIQQYEVVYSPSASVLQSLVTRSLTSKPKQDSPMVVGIPDEAAPQIEQEVQAIAHLMTGSRVLMGSEATTKRFAEDSGSASIIHLACHGRFVPSSPLSSGLKFADRWFTVRDLYALRLNNPLVVLSGCDTGLMRVQAADELAGLQRGLFAAGASSLISALWALKDETAAKMMASLYNAWYKDSLRTGRDLAEILRSVQCQIMVEQPHPAFWAPLILVGNS